MPMSEHNVTVKLVQMLEPCIVAGAGKVEA